jgi:hypothetical protein
VPFPTGRIMAEPGPKRVCPSAAAIAVDLGAKTSEHEDDAHGDGVCAVAPQFVVVQQEVVTRFSNNFNTVKAFGPYDTTEEAAAAKRHLWNRRAVDEIIALGMAGQFASKAYDITLFLDDAGDEDNGDAEEVRLISLFLDEVHPGDSGLAYVIDDWAGRPMSGPGSGPDLQARIEQIIARFSSAELCTVVTGLLPQEDGYGLCRVRINIEPIQPGPVA